MIKKFIFTMTLSIVICGVGCASQEDLLYADLWSDDSYIAIPSSNQAIQNLGKTPRAQMLEQRKYDEARKNQTFKDQLLYDLILGKDRKLNL